MVLGAPEGFTLRSSACLGGRVSTVDWAGGLGGGGGGFSSCRRTLNPTSFMARPILACLTCGAWMVWIRVSLDTVIACAVKVGTIMYSMGFPILAGMLDLSVCMCVCVRACMCVQHRWFGRTASLDTVFACALKVPPPPDKKESTQCAKLKWTQCSLFFGAIAQRDFGLCKVYMQSHHTCIPDTGVQV
jgi:hypothetical protein